MDIQEQLGRMSRGELIILLNQMDVVPRLKELDILTAKRENALQQYECLLGDEEVEEWVLKALLRRVELLAQLIEEKTGSRW